MSRSPTGRHPCSPYRDTGAGALRADITRSVTFAARLLWASTTDVKQRYRRDTLDLGHSHVLAYIAASGKAVPPRWVGERQLPLMASQYVSVNRANGQAPRPWPLRIEPGDTLVIYTDGLVEARKGKEEYGMRQLREKVAEFGARPASEIAQGIVESVNGFTGGGAHRDDVTLVVVKRKGLQE